MTVYRPVCRHWLLFNSIYFVYSLRIRVCLDFILLGFRCGGLNLTTSVAVVKARTVREAGDAAQVDKHEVVTQLE